MNPELEDFDAQMLFKTQWSAYYYAHSYAFLHPYIRYLAISSISRIDNEPALCIITLKSSLVMAMTMYWIKELQGCNETDKMPGRLRKDILGKKAADYIQDIINAGKEAEDPFTIPSDYKQDPRIVQIKKPPFDYSNKQIVKILNSYIEALKICNEKAKKNEGYLFQYFKIQRNFENIQGM